MKFYLRLRKSIAPSNNLCVETHILHNAFTLSNMKYSSLNATNKFSAIHKNALLQNERSNPLGGHHKLLLSFVSLTGLRVQRAFPLVSQHSRDLDGNVVPPDKT